MIGTIAAWTIAFAVAFALDARVAIWSRDSGLGHYLKTNDLLAGVMKAPGDYWFTVVVAMLVFWRHPLHWRGSLFLLLGTLLSGVNGLIKWMVGRWRPFTFPLHRDDAMPFSCTPFRGGITGLFQSKNLCFPSGHACLAFATAAALAILWPRLRWAFYAMAAIVAVERFAENAHWLSDNVGAAALGIGGVYLIRRLTAKHLLEPPQLRGAEAPALHETAREPTPTDG